MKIEVGQVFSTNLYNRGRCAVIEVKERNIDKNSKIYSLGSNGFKRATNDNHYDLISLDGQHKIKSLPDCILTGAGWTDCEYSVSQEKVSELIVVNKKVQEQREIERKLEEERYLIAQDKIAEEWDDKLNRLENAYDMKETNKNIRKFLKIKFPNVKCSVRKSGHSVYITMKNETDNSIKQQIENEVKDAFSNSYFDGMQDMKVTVKNPFAELYGKIDFVFMY